MPHHDDKRIRDMLEYAREANSMVQGKTRADLDDDRKLNLALVRLLEVIGEAAARVSQQERDRYPGVPWSDIIGLRNRLVHGYDSVDFDVLWQIVASDLPTLIATIERGSEP